jgi:crotonobetainyl-CoA:carnitine CoA-transferase CaiB-like acyl-CoA transferase
LPNTNEILKGVRILTFTTGYAGPYAGRLLAGYGAEVIKIESRKGGLDTFRHYGQHKDIDAAPRFIECNLGVRSLSINLKHPTGARLIRELAGKSDAILQNFRPRVLDKLGLGDDELRKSNPKLVIVKLPGFGSEGPKSSYGTWGFNLTAFSGMTYLWNHPDQDRPIGSQGVYPDHLGFIMGPTIMVAALPRSRLTGKVCPSIWRKSRDGLHARCDLPGCRGQWSILSRGATGSRSGSAWLLSLPRRRSLVRDLRPDR